MLKLAVVGKDVSKSQSPSMHKFILKDFGESAEYDTVSVPPEAFEERAEELLNRYAALNVTIPYKRRIIPFLKGTEGDAAVFGAVNTVIARTGYNTDGFGFLLMLENAGVEISEKSALVLGAGGAGRSCIKKLSDAGAEVFAYERDEERLASVAAEFSFTPLEEVPVRAYDIIINCTGVGMHDTVGKTPTVRFRSGEKPVGEELLSLTETAVDLIYEPAQSEFLRIAAKLKKRTVNGGAMLFYQAYMADCILLNKQPDKARAKALYAAYREEIK